ncbi:MAG: CocE/NonD family hydrolase [Actinomycetota bacterium]|nr:CocE/NonD family hydrolase [Actinomycetota bacterium]
MLWQGLRRVALAAVCAGVLAPVAHAADPPPGADWEKATIPSTDGVTLYADILRPKGIPKDQKTPVILSIGPYFNHSGQLGPLGLAQDSPYDPITGGPSDRFYDFINGAKVFDRGYTWVQVDLRGFGGSNGCLDWSGPGERADVKAAVEWAAEQPWSTGKVGMYGKSYDGVTGMLGISSQPKGLAAVISQEPVYDMYRYLYSNRVRYVNASATPNLYNAIAASPGTAGDTLAYNEASLNDLSRPGCPAFNFADQQDPNHDSAYWKERDLIAAARGKKTPFFLTQGLLENNTKPDGSADYYNALAGPKRAWFGMWDHVRGNDKNSQGRLAMGRPTWFEEAMRFYDRYVAGKPDSEAPVSKDPPVALQTNDGKWRSEVNWPPPDRVTLTAPLKTGTYIDDTYEGGYNDGATPNIWTFSPAFPHDVELAGTPKATLDVQVGAPNANLVVDVYDVDEKGMAIIISRQAYLLPGSGKVSFDLYDQHWKMPAGHRLGVMVTSSNQGWWTHVPTGQQVTVRSAQLALPFVQCRRGDAQAIEGASAIRLDNYKRTQPFQLPDALIRDNTVPGFPLPEPLRGCSDAEVRGLAECVDRRKFTFRIKQPRKGRIVRATAYLDGKKIKTVRGRRVTRLTIAKFPKGNHTLRIVAQHASRKKTISTREYRGCRKGKPSTIVRS